MRKVALLNGALTALLASVVLAFAGGTSMAEGRRDATSSQLIFVRYADTPGPCLACDHSLFVVGSDGSGLRKLMDEGEDPAWSPDGAKIAYVSDGYEKSPEGIFVVNADGRGKRRILPGYFGSPRWSPDGTRLVFAGRRGLGIVNLKSGTRRWLALPRGLGAGDPDWSPDGGRIAFGARIGAYPDQRRST